MKLCFNLLLSHNTEFVKGRKKNLKILRVFYWIPKPANGPDNSAYPTPNPRQKKKTHLKIGKGKWPNSKIVGTVFHFLPNPDWL